MDQPYMQNQGNGLPVDPVTPQPSNPSPSSTQDMTQIPQQFVQQMQQPMQIPTKYCKHCAAQIPADAVICTSCGRQVELLERQQPSPQVQPQQIIINNANNNVNTNHVSAGGVGRKAINKTTALLLCAFLGWAGVHRFYEGRTMSGLLYLFTFGLGGIGWAIDFIAILLKPNPYYV